MSAISALDPPKPSRKLHLLKAGEALHGTGPLLHVPNSAKKIGACSAECVETIEPYSASRWLNQAGRNGEQR